MKMRIATGIALALAASLIAAPNVAAQGEVLCDGKAVTIFGTPGDDAITGTGGDDVIFAMQGNDRIDAGKGDDTICAGQGDDILIGGEGFDIMFGAQGDDIIYSANQSALGRARSDIRGARMFGGAGDDVIFGSDRWDRMQGGPGADQLWGFEGQDWIRGGADMDEVYGGSGTDDVHGGNGSDRIAVDRGDIVKGGAGADWCVVTGQAESTKSCGTNQFEAVPNQNSVTLQAGTYRVGAQAPPGYYRTSDFYSVDDQDGRTITNGNTLDDNGHLAAVVKPSAFSVEFDRSAVRVDSTTPTVNPIGQTEGTFFVGLDIQPGTYRVVPDGSNGTVIQAIGGRGFFLEQEASVDGSSTLTVPPEAVTIRFIGRLERV